MEISDTISSILAEKNRMEIWSIAPDDTVFSAITLMSEKNVGALPVFEGDTLAGIISERDYTRKVFLRGRSSKETTVREIMSSPVHCVPPTSSVIASLELMTARHIRHLPVVVDGKVIGIVSIGDLVRRTIFAQGALIQQLENYVTASYPA